MAQVGISTSTVHNSKLAATQLLPVVRTEGGGLFDFFRLVHVAHGLVLSLHGGGEGSNDA